MQFINNAPVYKLIRITGPTHNLLVLRLSRSAVADPLQVEALDTPQNCLNPIGEHEVIDRVLNAIEDHEAESGNRYFIEGIQYVPSDSRPVDVYYEMAKEILRRIEMQPS